MPKQLQRININNILQINGYTNNDVYLYCNSQKQRSHRGFVSKTRNFKKNDLYTNQNKHPISILKLSFFFFTGHELRMRSALAPPPPPGALSSSPRTLGNRVHALNNSSPVWPLPPPTRCQPSTTSCSWRMRCRTARR